MHCLLKASVQPNALESLNMSLSLIVGFRYLELLCTYVDGVTGKNVIPKKY